MNNLLGYVFSNYKRYCAKANSNNKPLPTSIGRDLITVANYYLNMFFALKISLCAKLFIAQNR